MSSDAAPHRATVVACVAPARQKRLAAALERSAYVTFCDSFEAVEESMSRASAWSVAVLDAKDSSGLAAGAVAGRLTAREKSTTVILYATAEEIIGGALSTPAIADVIIAGETDGVAFLETIILNAFKRIAADRVVGALRARIKGSLVAFAETAVRHPSCGTVQAVADQMRIHRQTAAVWCRKERFLRAEELLVWCRLLLAAALLENTDRSVATLALDLDFPSSVALRNQVKRYTGMTPLLVREAGLEAVLRLFDGEVERARGVRTGESSSSAGRAATVGAMM